MRRKLRDRNFSKQAGGPKAAASRWPPGRAGTCPEAAWGTSGRRGGCGIRTLFRSQGLKRCGRHSRANDAA